MDHHEAIITLRRVGKALSKTPDIDVAPELIDDYASTEDLIALCVFFRNHKSPGALPSTWEGAKRAFWSVKPRHMTKEIRESVLDRGDRKEGPREGGYSLAAWGEQLSMNAQGLVEFARSPAFERGTYEVPRLRDVRSKETCADQPGDTGELLSLLNGAIGSACLSSRTAEWLGLGTVIFTAIGTFLVIGRPWNLGHRAELHGAESLFLMMLCLCVLSAAICAAISWRIAPPP